MQRKFLNVWWTESVVDFILFIFFCLILFSHSPNAVYLSVFFFHSSKIFNNLSPPFHFWTVFDANVYCPEILSSCDGPQSHLRTFSLPPNTVVSSSCWNFHLKTSEWELPLWMLLTCALKDPVSTTMSLPCALPKPSFNLAFEFLRPSSTRIY